MACTILALRLFSHPYNGNFTSLLPYNVIIGGGKKILLVYSGAAEIVGRRNGLIIYILKAL